MNNPKLPLIFPLAREVWPIDGSAVSLRLVSKEDDAIAEYVDSSTGISLFTLEDLWNNEYPLGSVLEAYQSTLIEHIVYHRSAFLRKTIFDSDLLPWRNAYGIGIPNVENMQAEAWPDNIDHASQMTTYAHQYDFPGAPLGVPIISCSRDMRSLPGTWELVLGGTTAVLSEVAWNDVTGMKRLIEESRDLEKWRLVLALVNPTQAESLEARLRAFEVLQAR